MQKELSIVAISWNKHHFLKRLIFLYSNHNYHLVIGDGSPDDWDLPKSGSFGKLTWEYFRIFDKNDPMRSYKLRVIESFSRVRTKYLVMIDEEELLIPIGLETAINELKSNPELSCAGGELRTYVVSDKNQIKIGSWGRKSRSFSVMQKSPQERMTNVLKEQRTANLWYQVTYTSTALKCIEGIDKVRVNFPDWFEIVFALRLARYGKWKMGKYPYWLRKTGISWVNDPKYKFKKYLDISDASIIAKMILPKKSKSSDEMHLSQLLLHNWGERVNPDIESFSDTKKRELPFASYIKKLIRITTRIKKIDYTSFDEYLAKSKTLDKNSKLDNDYIKSIIEKFPNGL